MDTNIIVAIAVPSAIGLILITIGILIFLGKGGFFIAGYNTQSEEEKSKYDIKALSKLVGGILLTIGVLTPSIPLGIIYGIKWISFTYPIVVISLIVFAVIFANTCKRFRKK